MKNNKDIEEMLINNLSYEEMMNKKLEEEFNTELTTLASSIKKEVTLIKDVPNDKLFSKDTIFEIINRENKTKTYINGIQAEGFLGDDNSARHKLLTKENDSFVAKNYYVKFVKANI